MYKIRKILIFIEAQHEDLSTRMNKIKFYFKKTETAKSNSLIPLLKEKKLYKFNPKNKNRKNKCCARS